MNPSLSPKTIELLETVAQCTEETPASKFDFSEFAGNDWAGAQDLSCGTTACAIGSAIARGKLPGMFFEKPVKGSNYVGVRYEEDGTTWTCKFAIAKYFDITPRQALYLFFPDNEDDGLPSNGLRFHASNTEVAYHIRQFIAHNGEMVNGGYGSPTKTLETADDCTTVYAN